MTSANIVGYEDVKTINPDGKSFIGMNFAKIGEAGVKLSDYVPNANFGNMGTTVTLLNEYGGVITDYEWMDESTWGDYLETDYPERFPAPGWYNKNILDDWGEETDPGEIYGGNVALDAGQCLLVQCGENGGLVFSGQVDKEAVELKIGAASAGNKAFLCNSMPTPTTLGKILPNKKFGNMGPTVTFLNEFGGVITDYEWMDESTWGDYKETDFPERFPAPGWYNKNILDDWDEESDPGEICGNNYPVPAGYGFMVQAPTVGAGVIIPSPLEEEK